MKIKLWAIALVGVLCALSAPVKVHATADLPVAPMANGNLNPQPMQNPSFIGMKVARVEQSTGTDTAVLLASGSGLLYAVAVTSGNSGYALAFDSASNSGITVNTAGKGLTPQVFNSSGAASCTAGGSCGLWVPPWPVRFENGLVGIKSGTNANALYYYRSDTGSNP